MDLKVVENGIVPVYENEDKQVVNARELHAFLGVGKRFADWVTDRIEKYGFVEGEDFAVCFPNLGSKTGSGGHNAKDYFLSLDCAKEIAMAENSDRGRQVRKYFIECERKLREIKLYGGFYSQLPKTFPDALRALAETEEKRLALETKVKEDAPKVLFAESVQASPTTILIGELAKILRQNGIQVGQNRLFKQLRSDKFLMFNGEGRNIPTQRAMEMGLFVVTETTITRPDKEPKIVTTTKVTGRGQLYFINYFLNKTAA
jgi:anti-repressor protein